MAENINKEAEYQSLQSSIYFKLLVEIMPSVALSKDIKNDGKTPYL